MARTLADVALDQERVFRELLVAQRELEALSRAGRELGLVDGETSDVDEALARVHAAQHRLDALAAEAIQAAVAAHPA
ncbi:MAG TPA: hypothetical protein VKV26_19380 [Dehalococcoidia bacterium]|nr:hypothetical protein [Dehalococcoidia bacterium]